MEGRADRPNMRPTAACLPRSTWPPRAAADDSRSLPPRRRASACSRSAGGGAGRNRSDEPAARRHIAACRTGAEGPGMQVVMRLVAIAGGPPRLSRGGAGRARIVAAATRAGSSWSPSAPRRASSRARRPASRTSPTTTCSTPSSGSSSPPRRCVIYALALRRRLSGREKLPTSRLRTGSAMMELTTLPNGLRVASREMPGIETAAVGLYAETGSRYEPAALNGIAHLFEHMVFKGAGGRSAREISEAIEDVGGDLNACDRPRFDQLHRLGDGRACPARRRADLRHDPAGPISPRPSWSARRTSCCRSSARRATRPTTSSSTICRRPPSPTSRSAGRCSATRRASPRSASRTSTAGARDQYRAGSLSLVAAGKVEHARLVELAERMVRRPRRPAPCRRPSRRISPAATGSAEAIGDQAHLALGFVGARPSSTRIIMPRACSPTSSAAACRRACSSSCARNGASLIRSGRCSSRGATSALTASMPRPRAASRPPPRSWSRRCSPRRPRAPPSASSTGSGPRPRPAC